MSSLSSRLRSSRAGLLLGALVIIALFAALAYFVDWRAALYQVQQANRLLLAASILLLLTGYIFYALRLRFLMNNRPTFGSVWHASNVGTMVNTLLPARPGDAVRLVLLSGSSGLSLVKSTSSLVVERWFEQVMRLAAMGGAFVFGTGLLVSRSAAFGAIAFLVLTFLFMLWLVRRRDYVLAHFPAWLARLPRVTETSARHGLVELIDALTSMASPLRMLEALLWSVVCWTFFWGYHFLVLLALQPDMGRSELVALSLGSLALVPPSASTLPGVYQVSMMVPLRLLGFDENVLASYSLLMNLIEMLVILALGLFGMFRSGSTWSSLMARIARQKAETEQLSDTEG